MAEYQAFHCMETGFSHLKTGCEDYADSLSGGGIRIAAISDGHGDRACLRSARGARFAVESALENMEIFANRLREQNRQEELQDPRKRERLLRHLIRCIIENWNTRVRQDLEEKPLTQEELSVQHRYSDAYRQGRCLSHVYGCTLIAAMIAEDHLIVLHHGDGRCVVLHQDGTADQPVPWDEMCIGNVTTSLCQADAAERCRYYVCDLRNDAVVGCFITSDGIEDSLEDLPEQNALCAYFGNVAARAAREGVDALREAMKQELPNMSRYGSQDDTSFGALLDVEAARKMAERFSLVYEMYTCGAEAERVRQKLNSMQRKMDVLRRDVERAEEDCTAADSGRVSLCCLQEELSRQIAQLEQLRENSVERQRQARERLEKARAAFEEYNAVHEHYTDREIRAADRLRQLWERLELLLGGRPEE